MHLASIPKIAKSGFTPGLESSYQRVLSAFDLAAGAGNPAKVVLVMSAVTGEGKASTAVQLAKLSSLGGNRTLLIELDLLRPRASVML
ncbi:MAG: Mrp family chromosome partitioning ATPase, partial [Verrucomicrobiales bacterium]